MSAAESVYPHGDDMPENFAIRAIKRDAFSAGIAYALDPENAAHLDILARADWMHDDPGISWEDAGEGDREYIRRGYRAALRGLRDRLVAE